MADRKVLAETNPPRVYGAEASARLIDSLHEDTAPYAVVNDILWHTIKGSFPEPPIRHAFGQGALPASRKDD